MRTSALWRAAIETETGLLNDHDTDGFQIRYQNTQIDEGGRPPNGSFRFSASDQNLNGDWVRISVQDNGIGLESWDLSRIFNPFEQVESSASRNFQGTGLGLFLTRSLVELHGGRFWVESDGRGCGSTFSFIIPA